MPVVLWELDISEEKLIKAKNKVERELQREGIAIQPTDIAYYFYFRASQNYGERGGKFWEIEPKINNEKLRNDLFNKFVDYLKRNNLFVKEELYRGTKGRVNFILLHTVIPKKFVKDYLDVVDKIFKDYSLDIDSILIMDKDELKNYFRYTIKTFRDLLENEETAIIFKNLIYESIKIRIEENFKSSLPRWFIDAIKNYQFKKINRSTPIGSEYNFLFIDENTIRLNEKILNKHKNDIFIFFDEEKKYIGYKKVENKLLLRKEPTYLAINKNFQDLIDIFEEDFNGYYEEYKAKNSKFNFYKLLDSDILIDEELDNLEIKVRIDKGSRITYEGLHRNQFPEFLQPEGIKVDKIFFEGFKITNTNEFEYLNIYNLTTKKPIQETEDFIKEFGLYEVEYRENLLSYVKKDKILVIPYTEIYLRNKKIHIDGNEYFFNRDTIIHISDYKFKPKYLKGYLEFENKKKHCIRIKKFDNRKLKIKIENFPDYLSYCKVWFNDVSYGKIFKRKKEFEIRIKDLENFNFPIRVYIEEKYIKTQIGLIKRGFSDSKNLDDIYLSLQIYTITMKKKNRVYITRKNGTFFVDDNIKNKTVENFPKHFKKIKNEEEFLETLETFINNARIDDLKVLLKIDGISKLLKENFEKKGQEQ